MCTSSSPGSYMGRLLEFQAAILSGSIISFKQGTNVEPMSTTVWNTPQPLTPMFKFHLSLTPSETIFFTKVCLFVGWKSLSVAALTWPDLNWPDLTSNLLKICQTFNPIWTTYNSIYPPFVWLVHHGHLDVRTLLGWKCWMKHNGKLWASHEA